MKHVPGTRNSAADALSRRPATKNNRSGAEKGDIDAFIDTLIQSIMSLSLRKKMKGPHLLS